MNTLDLKSNLYKLIDSVEEDAILEVLQDVIQSFIKKEESQLCESLSEAEKSAIEEGLMQVVSGLVVSHEEVKTQYAKWVINANLFKSWL